MQWHGDTFDLPVGVDRLATSRQFENQAFAKGDWLLAVQFHLVGEVRVAVGLVGRLVAAEHHDEVGLERVERCDIRVRCVDRHDAVAVRLERGAEVSEPDRRIVPQNEGGAGRVHSRPLMTIASVGGEARLGST